MLLDDVEDNVDDADSKRELELEAPLPAVDDDRSTGSSGTVA